MRTTQRYALIAVLALAYAVLSGCAPCKDYKLIIEDLNTQITGLEGDIAGRDATIAEGEQLATDLREQIAQVEAEKDVIIEQLGVAGEEVVNEASFLDDLGADSLDLVELIMAIEEEYGIEIPDDDAEKIQTIQDAITYIEERTQKDN